jgi:hypothetical protein
MARNFDAPRRVESGHKTGSVVVTLDDGDAPCRRCVGRLGRMAASPSRGLPLHKNRSCQLD